MSSASSSASNNVNKRGTACLNCRKRKVKCDTVKPSCGPCAKAGLGDDCEYNDTGPSRTRVLEHTISQLQARVWELENQSCEVPFQSGGDLEVEIQSYDLQPFSRQDPSTGALSLSSAAEPYKEPPMFFRRILLHNFIHHATQVGFFLDAVELRESALLDLPTTDYHRPTPALMATIYLWGVNFSQSDTLLSHESAFLHAALQLAPTTLSSQHPQKTIQAIQNTILLAVYFFHTGRILEGKAQANLATSIAFNNGLHIFRPMRELTGYETEYSLTQERKEEVFRNKAFWATIFLNNVWSGAVGYQSAFSYSDPNARVSAPWPCVFELDLSNHLPMTSGFTLTDFLSGIPDEVPLRDLSVTQIISTLLVKSSVLFERASHLFAQSSHFSSPSIEHVNMQAFRTLNELILQVRSQLPSIDDVRQMDTCMQRGVLSCHALTNLAMIQLHRRFTSVCADSQSFSVDAAFAVAQWSGLVVESEMTYVCPIMAILWFMTSQVLMDELSAASSAAAANPPIPNTYTEEQIDYTHQALEKVAMAMAHLSPHSPLMRYQFSKLQEAFAANSQVR